MNWIDIILILVLTACIVWGARVGLVGATLYFVGTLIGWAVSGRVSQVIGSTFNDSLSLDTTITTLIYILIVGASVVLTRSVLKLLKPGMPVLDIATLGLNRILGMGVGLALGLIFVCILITGLTRFTYDFDVGSQMVGLNSVSNNTLVNTGDVIAKVESTKSLLENDFATSKISPLIIGTLRNIPADGFGLVPTDFMAALDILDSKL